jgi:hypothetical protein
MKDNPISVDRLNKLHPKVRGIFRLFVEDAERELGITLRITQGMRTIAEQNTLYAQGRDGNPGKIVTNAKGGSSYHNYGLAIDVLPIKGGQPDWNYDYSKLQPIAERHGIVWGGTFQSIIDKPHFELSLGYKPSQLAGITKDKYGYPLV